MPNISRNSIEMKWLFTLWLNRYTHSDADIHLLEAAVVAFPNSRSGVANTATLLALRGGGEAGEGGSCDIEKRIQIRRRHHGV